MTLFNVRVYGLLINENNELLVSDEWIKGKAFTKFPGGGLEFGEGTKDCLIREFQEETGAEITIKKHLYTTDFFQLNAWNSSQQIIAIYYLVETKNWQKIASSSKPFDFTAEQLANKEIQVESFRWIPINTLTTDCVTLPIDKVVIGLLKEEIKQL